jgi:hypothetical protein
MPLSAKSLHASGRISDKQMSKLAVLRGSHSQKSKMAPFDGKKRDEGAKGNRGIPEVCDYEIDKPSVQSRSNMSKGGKAGPEGGTLKRKQIDTRQTPKFPAGGDVKASNPKTGNTRMKGGRVQKAGVVYNVPGRN